MKNEVKKELVRLVNEYIASVKALTKVRKDIDDYVKELRKGVCNEDIMGSLTYGDSEFVQECVRRMLDEKLVTSDECNTTVYTLKRWAIEDLKRLGEDIKKYEKYNAQEEFDKYSE